MGFLFIISFTIFVFGQVIGYSVTFPIVAFLLPFCYAITNSYRQVRQVLDKRNKREKITKRMGRVKKMKDEKSRRNRSFAKKILTLWIFWRKILFGLLIISLAWISSFGAKWWNDRRYYKPIQHIRWNVARDACTTRRSILGKTGKYSLNKCTMKGLWCYEDDEKWGKQCYYLGTGRLTSHDKPTRFVLTDWTGRTFLVYIADWQKDMRKEGDEVFVSTKVEMVEEGGIMKNIKGTTAKQKKSETNGKHIYDFSGGGISSMIHLTNLVPEYNFDFKKWMRMKGYYGVIYQPDMITLKKPFGGKNGSILLRYTGNKENKGSFHGEHFTSVANQNKTPIDRIRQGLKTMVTNVYGNGKVSGLILGMLIGDKSMIPDKEYQTFINSNLVHIVAVSGGNIVMLVIFLSFLLRRVPYYARLVLLFGSVMMYAMICGADSSVMRATIMGGLGLVTLFVGRDISIWRLMAYAWVGMLLRNPYLLVYDVGFLLSFGAIVGLVRIGTFTSHVSFPEPEEQQISTDDTSTGLHRLTIGWTWIYKQIIQFGQLYVLPTLGASMGVLPFILFFMQKINLTGMVANLFVLPLVPLTMVWTLMSSLVINRFGTEGEWWSQLAFVLEWVGRHLIDYVYWMSRWGEKIGIYLEIHATRLQWMVLILGVIRFVKQMKKT